MFKKSIALIGIFFMTLTAYGEPIDEIVKGAHYYKKGFLNDQQVKVISIDYSRNKVKIFDPNDNQVYLVTPDSLVNFSDSLSRDIKRFEIGVEIAQTVFKLLSQSTNDSSGGSRLYLPEKFPDKFGANSKSNRWSAGKQHPTYDNVVSAAEKGKLAPSPGYVWVDVKKSWDVSWKPGLQHPANDTVSSYEKDKWISKEDYFYTTLEKREKVIDQHRKPFPPPPNVNGRLFQSTKDFEIYIELDPLTVYIFHNPDISDKIISHLLYHYDENWVVAVLEDGTRLDLGAHIQWLIRPYWRQANKLYLVKTKNRQTIYGIEVELKKTSAQSKYQTSEKYIMGIEGKDISDFIYNGMTYIKGVKIERVFDNMPAQKSGLKKGDIILTINDHYVDSMDFLSSYTQNCGGKKMTVDIIRNNQLRTIDIKPVLATRGITS